MSGTSAEQAEVVREAALTFLRRELAILAQLVSVLGLWRVVRSLRTPQLGGVLRCRR